MHPLFTPPCFVYTPAQFVHLGPLSTFLCLLLRPLSALPLSAPPPNVYKPSDRIVSICTPALCLQPHPPDLCVHPCPHFRPFLAPLLAYPLGLPFLCLSYLVTPSVVLPISCPWSCLVGLLLVLPALFDKGHEKHPGPCGIHLP